MSNNSHDWSCFTVRINVNAPVNKLLLKKRAVKGFVFESEDMLKTKKQF